MECGDRFFRKENIVALAKIFKQSEEDLLTPRRAFEMRALCNYEPPSSFQLYQLFPDIIRHAGPIPPA